jgi:cadmium resistance protein CadD (predicted permease)
VWCLAASWLGSHEKAIAATQRYGHWIVPGVFIVIGAVIVIESGVISRLSSKSPRNPWPLVWSC